MAAGDHAGRSPLKSRAIPPTGSRPARGRGCPTDALTSTPSLLPEARTRRINRSTTRQVSAPRRFSQQLSHRQTSVAAYRGSASAGSASAASHGHQCVDNRPTPEASRGSSARPARCDGSAAPSAVLSCGARRACVNLSYPQSLDDQFAAGVSVISMVRLTSTLSFSALKEPGNAVPIPARPDVDPD